MKTAAIGAVGALLLAGSLFMQGVAGFSAVTGDRVNDEFAGVISDSICAENGSHIGVIKNGHITPMAACVRACVKFDGAQFVLYDKQAKRIYKLDNQVQPEPFAGQKVIVTGTYDERADTIRVKRIQPVIENAL
jgi:hypothetical protein